MLPNQPWIKVLKTANNKEQAQKIVEKLQKKGYHDLVTISPQSNNKKYQIGIFDDSKIDIFDEMDAKSGLKMEKCGVCGKSKYETKFFLCTNCDAWECYPCGVKRLFKANIPNIHICGQDNFEFLANIGPCVNCGEPLGFKSIPPKLRIQMMSKLPTGKIQMMTLGLIGAYSAEKIFLDKEISVIYESTLQLIDSYKKGNLIPYEWLKLYKSIKSNILRLEWSCDYILQVSDNVLNSVKKNIYQEISKKMKMIHSELEFQKVLHSTIVNLIENKISKSDYNNVLSAFVNVMNTEFAQLFSQEAKDAIAKLSTLSDQIQNNSNFNELYHLIGELFFTNYIKEVMNKIPAHLKC